MEMDQDTKDQLARQYQTSIEDIRLFKNTEWRITATCYAIFGAIIGFSDKLGDHNCAIYVLIGFVVLFGILGVCSTNRALTSARNVISNIQQTYTHGVRRFILGMDSTRDRFEDRFDRWIFPLIFYAAIFLAAAVTGLVICNTTT